MSAAHTISFSPWGVVVLAVEAVKETRSVVPGVIFGSVTEVTSILKNRDLMRGFGYDFRSVRFRIAHHGDFDLINAGLYKSRQGFLLHFLLCHPNCTSARRRWGAATFQSKSPCHPRYPPLLSPTPARVEAY